MKWFYLDQSLFTDMIADALVKAGMSVRTSDKYEDSTSLQSKLEMFDPDVILTSGWNNAHTESNFKTIRNYCNNSGAFYVHWSFEDPLHTETWSKFIVNTGRPDYMFTHDYDSTELYRRIGIPSSYLPFACHPDWQKAHIPLEEFSSDISLIATYKPWIDTEESYRIKSLKKLLYPLIENGFEVNVWGPGWVEHRNQLSFEIPEKCLRGPIDYKDISKVYSSSKIVLGIQNADGLLTQRTYESLACGSFLLTTDSPAVHRHFTVGEHLLTSMNPEDTVQLANYYLKHSKKRRAISSKGKTYVREHHTYVHRIEEMVKKINPYLKSQKINSRSTLIQNPLPVDQMNSQQQTNKFILSERRPKRIIIKKDMINENFKMKSTKLTLTLPYSPVTRNPVLHCHFLLNDLSDNMIIQGYIPQLSGRIMTLKAESSSNNEYYFDITELIKQMIESSNTHFGISLQPSVKTFSPQININ